MSQITRTGPPTPRGVKGRLFTWTVPISRVPHPQWKSFFTHTKDRSLASNPDGVRFYLATAIFESDDESLPTWIEFLDRWIVSANERFAKWEEEQARERAAAEEMRRDPATRMREAAEKFKHL